MRGKAFVAILIVSIAMILTGCKTIKNTIIPQKPDLDRAFSCEIKISAFGDFEACGTMERYGTNIWEMDLSSPETVAGLRIRCNDDGVNASLEELYIEIPREKINKNAVFELIFGAVDNFAALPSAELSETENGYEYHGTLPQGAYTMTFDREMRGLTGIAFPELDISAEINMNAE